MVISDALKLLSDELSSHREAELLLSDILGMNIPDLVFKKNLPLSKADEDMLNIYKTRRKCGEPIQYIIGKTEFMSLPFKVSPSVLIPRSDTETLVELLIEKIGDKKLSAIDIGTGSGCIGISLLKYCRNLTLTALDISENALMVSKDNAKANGVYDRMEFLNLDILENIPQGKFDVIVSNPPYIRPEVINTLDVEVKDFEPYSALYGGDDGLLFYRRISAIAPQILNKDGLLAFEIGYDQGESVKKIMEKNFHDTKIFKDLCHNDRVVIGTNLKIKP